MGTIPLRDVYITWKGKEVRVVPKSEGKPGSDKFGDYEGWYDYEDWKLSPVEFFLEQFTSLTCSGARPRQVYDEFCKIREFEVLDDRASSSFRKRRAA